MSAALVACAELVLRLFVFFICANSSWNSSPPIGGGTSFPSSRAALFFLVPRTSFPSFPSSQSAPFWGLTALGTHLERRLFLGAADIQAVNQQPIDEVLTMLHEGK